MRDIDQAIAAQKATITRLQKEIERRQRDVETLERARVLLAGREESRPQERIEALRGHPKKGLLEPDSDAGRTHAVLQAAGHALHIEEIMSGIKAKYGESPKYTSLVGALSRYAKRGQHFARTPGRPNTFELPEWREGK